jgi:hypothetical protein
MQLFLDIEKAGEHEIMFSMREDGFEMDKFVLASNKEFKPEGKGPAVKVKAGKMPAAFPEVAEAAPAPKKFPAHWGKPPEAQTMDYIPLPGGYGHGSSTMARWIQGNLNQGCHRQRGFIEDGGVEFLARRHGLLSGQGQMAGDQSGKEQDRAGQAGFPFPGGRYDVTLEAVGEEDGKSTYTVAVNDQAIGTHECPIAPSAMDEGAVYHRTWKNQQVDAGDVITVSSTIASRTVRNSAGRAGRGLLCTGR